ncbi:hypothetical protein B0F90DRAFT_1768665 [Multifurca ochricompacta]|uniref:Secreted protein n=1 Tax=Multifurca ochricompacta TaxID=376703 RepID=A0AAD4LYG4_9AGAM|nr:hypothetical protein B0F90DRAFT_1768665 [Multifurca ochricompacta]
MCFLSFLLLLLLQPLCPIYFACLPPTRPICVFTSTYTCLPIHILEEETIFPLYFWNTDCVKSRRRGMPSLHPRTFG